MAYVGSANNVVSNGAGTYLFVLKAALKAANWTVLQSSLGTGSVVSGEIINTAADFGLANAWARLQEPTFPGQFARREYILQNGTLNGTTALIKYSRATGFNTGGTAAVAPTTGVGGDGVLIVGNTVTGTDASPGTATGFANATGYVAAVASDTPSPGTYGGFSWYLLGYTAGGANIITCFTEAVAPGSTSSLDQDPMWRLGAGSTFSPVTPTTPSPSSLGGAYFSNAWTGHSYWQAYGLTSPSYIRAGQLGLPICIAPTTAASKTIAYTAGFASVSPYDGREPMYPLLLGQAGVPSSVPSVPQSIPKGYTTGVVLFGATHNLLDTFNLNTTDPKIAIALTANSLQSVAMPWLTNIVPAV